MGQKTKLKEAQMRTSWSILGVACMLAFSGADHVRAEVTTLRVTATPSFYGEMYRNLVLAFEQKHPDVQIRLDLPAGDQTDMIQATLRSVSVNDLPDVSFQGFNFLRTLDEQKLLVPLERFIAGDPDWTSKEYSGSVTSAAKVDGKLVGLGCATAFPILYYNGDLVAEAQGGNDQLPSDWDGIMTVAAKIQALHPNVLGIYSRYNLFIFQGLLDSRGGRIMSADGSKATFTEQPGRDAVALLRRIGEAGQAKADMTLDQLQQAFVGGTVAIKVNSSSSIAGLEKKINGRFHMKTALLPILSDKAGLPTAGVAVVMFTNDPARQKLAWQFMKFVTSAEGQAIVGKSTGYVPANQVATERADILGDYYGRQPAMRAALAAVPLAVSYYAFPGSNSARIEKLVEDALREVITLRKSPQQAIAELERDIQAFEGN
jgi:multiple sugar transport system substrate-binding protein